MSAALEDPQAPPHRWDELQAKLDAEEYKPAPISRPGRRWRSNTKFFAIAASLLIATGLGVLAYEAWRFSSQHDRLAGEFQHYLEEFDKNPQNAQQILLTKFDGSRTTLKEASAILRYDPLIAKGFPSGCSCNDLYLLKMPCCTCPQAVCKCDNGQHIAVFEHDEDQPAWFGDRPTVNCLCDGKPTSIVQIDDKLAATWKQGKRYLTVIGIGDTADIVRLVAWFEDRTQNGPQL